MDSEKGNRVSARGHNVPPPWFLEHKKPGWDRVLRHDYRAKIAFLTKTAYWSPIKFNFKRIDWQNCMKNSAVRFVKKSIKAA